MIFILDVQHGHVVLFLLGDAAVQIYSSIYKSNNFYGILLLKMSD